MWQCRSPSAIFEIFFPQINSGYKNISCQNIVETERGIMMASVQSNEFIKMTRIYDASGHEADGCGRAEEKDKRYSSPHLYATIVDAHVQARNAISKLKCILTNSFFFYPLLSAWSSRYFRFI